MFHLDIWPNASWTFTNHCLLSFWSLKQPSRNNNNSDFPTFVWLILEHSSTTSESPPPPWVWRQRKKMVNKSFVNTLYGKGNNLLFWAGLFSSYRTLSSCLSHWLFISKQQATFWLLMSWEKRLLQFGPTDVFGRVWKVALNFDSIQDWFPHSVCVWGGGGETQCTCWL